tara:strand:- start:1 stop:480 length:480 start_codon:yes stop_codon:yes gene_type:complete
LEKNKMEIFRIKLNKVLIELVCIFLIIFVTAYFNIVDAQQSFSAKDKNIVSIPGPIMFCGDNLELQKLFNGYKEQEFIVLVGSELSKDSTYYILHRNHNTSSWSLVIYKVKNAPENIVCLMSSGSKSYIAPNLDDMTKILKKQKEGFDDPITMQDERSS